MPFNIDYEVEALADMLGPGQHTGLNCPKCRSNDRAMSMLVDPPAIKAVCHRASCGYVYTNHKTPPHGGASPYSRPDRVRPYTGDLHSLDHTDVEWFDTRFGLPANWTEHIRKSEGRYFMPILGPEGRRRGWAARRPWDGSPLDGHSSMQKVVTYMELDEPVMHWTGTSRTHPMALVEDQISALKYTFITGSPAVALLGTGVNQEKVEELQRHTKHILIALDSDATGQAFYMARKWGQAFESCRVIILKHDLKDTDAQTIRSIFR